jgi:hypothetical protein
MLTNEGIRILLLDKHDRIIRGQRTFQSVSLSVCVGLLIYLIGTAILRPNDSLFIVLNTVIILLVIPSALSIYNTLQQLSSNNNGIGNIKELLEARLVYYKRCVRRSRWQSVFIVILVGLLEISIHTFFRNTNMSVIFFDEESRWGLLAGFCAGSLSALIAVKVLMNHFKNNLSVLSSILKNIED